MARFDQTYLDRFAHDLLLDAALTATRAYWLARARAWMQAGPRPGDLPGTDPDPEGRARRRAEIADLEIQRCLLLARLADYEDLADLAADVLAETRGAA